MRQRDSADSVTAVIARYKAIEQQMVADLAEWRRRAEVAEAQAAERQKTIEIQDRAMRMLENGQQPATSSTPVMQPASPEPPPEPPPAVRRPSWFRRRRPQPVHN